MNPFFDRRTSTDFKIPPRVYARTIDGGSATYVLFDAVDAEWFDLVEAKFGDALPGHWPDLINAAPIYAIEINSRNHSWPVKRSRLKNRARFPRWVEIELERDLAGPAEVYNVITGPPQRANLAVKAMTFKKRRAVKKATALTVAPDATILAELPSTPVDQIFVLDVGQGSASALLNNQAEVIAYVDLGAGVLADSRTWPATAMTGICLAHDPLVILTHWHYDHFEAANLYSSAKQCTWIAPLQTLGPGPQSAMANDIIANGTLLVWGGSGSLSHGSIELERCTGPTGNFNRTGIAVWVEGPNGGDPILLAGDAGYSDIPGLGGTPRSITSLVVSHHGGNAPGTPPADPGLGVTRAAMSFGRKNSYGHPLSRSVKALQNSGWNIGPFPGTRVDDRRTEDRTQGLGHIGLQWPHSKHPKRTCGCGCSIEPTQ